jgi:hypothetical protein
MIKNKIHFFILISLLLSISFPSNAQINPSRMFDTMGSDMDNSGGDIFSDFNEDLEASQVVEDERFYRYGRFFSFNIGTGITRFTGNRGEAYSLNPGGDFNISVQYFFGFQASFLLGFQYSKHQMLIDTYVARSQAEILGAIDVTMLRPFFAFRYYMNTANYGNAITYSNPYAVMRLEYWYQTNEFAQADGVDKETGGGMGTGIGFGFEFPVELKKAYVNVEFLWHSVAFKDKFTDDYSAVDGVTEEGYSTFEDLTGNAYSIYVTYNMTW